MWSPWTEASLLPRMRAPRRPGLGIQMGAVSPEAQPPGGARGGREERKARPLTLLPARPSAVSSILGTWLDQGAEDSCQPPSLSASGSWWPPCSSTSPAPTWSTRTSARGRWVGGHGGCRDWPQTAHVGTAIWGPQSGASGKGGETFPIFGRQALGTSRSAWTYHPARRPAYPLPPSQTSFPFPVIVSVFNFIISFPIIHGVIFFCLFSFCFLSIGE